MLHIHFTRVVEDQLPRVSASGRKGLLYVQQSHSGKQVKRRMLPNAFNICLQLILMSMSASRKHFYS